MPFAKGKYVTKYNASISPLEHALTWARCFSYTEYLSLISFTHTIFAHTYIYKCKKNDACKIIFLPNDHFVDLWYRIFSYIYEERIYKMKLFGFLCLKNQARYIVFGMAISYLSLPVRWEGRYWFLRCFQQLRLYRDERKTRNQEAVAPASLLKGTLSSDINPTYFPVSVFILLTVGFSVKS